MTATIDTPPKPAPADPAQIHRATELAARLLAGHGHHADRKAATAKAFGRALAATAPGSDHGKILAAALRPAEWKNRSQQERLVHVMARRGETPTAAALASRIAGTQAHRARLDRLHAEAAPIIERDVLRAALFVAATVRDTGSGPTWRELVAAMDWPARPWGLKEKVIRGLAGAGWLTFTTEPRSLRPGPAARQAAGRTA